MGVPAVTIMVDDQQSMHRAADCTLKWLERQPEHVPGTEYALIVCGLPDGRVTVSGVPPEALPEIRRAGVAFELMN